MKSFKIIVLAVLAVIGLSIWLIEFYRIANVGEIFGLSESASLVPTVKSQPIGKEFLLTIDHDVFDAPTPGNLIDGDDSFIVLDQAGAATRTILSPNTRGNPFVLRSKAVLSFMVQSTGLDNAIEPYEPLFAQLALATFVRNKNALTIMPIYDAGIRNIFINKRVMNQVANEQWNAVDPVIGYVIRADGSKRMIKIIGIPPEMLSGFVEVEA